NYKAVEHQIKMQTTISANLAIFKPSHRIKKNFPNADLLPYIPNSVKSLIFQQGSQDEQNFNEI
ncbi:8837_t:CDS:1, partial [Gigaspora rosea]